MKYIMNPTIVASALPVGAALPAPAADQGATKTQEQVHATTNRIDQLVPDIQLVPDMKGPNAQSDQGKSSTYNSSTDEPNNENADAQTGDKKQEGVLAPTNRVGQEVPTMKSAKSRDDQSKTQTTE